MDTTLKQCTICKEKKPRTAEYFYRQTANKDGLFNRCKKCDNKKTDIRKNQRYQALKEKPCVDCGIQYLPCAMSLDHVGGLNKTIHLSQAGSYSNERFLKEAQNCEVVCLNCHAVRSWKPSTEMSVVNKGKRSLKEIHKENSVMRQEVDALRTQLKEARYEG